jgi:hypothetical protein
MGRKTQEDIKMMNNNNVKPITLKYLKSAALALLQLKNTGLRERL